MDELALSAAQTRAFCTFWAQERLLGLDVSCVREVSVALPMTPVPQAPAPVRGLVNLRSQIYLVLDLRPLLGMPLAEPGADARLVILQPRIAEHMAILVDRGGDIVRASPAQIEDSDGPGSAAAEPGADRPLPFIAGVCKLEHDLLMIIDPKSLLDAIVRLNRETVA
jgi:purine-binding chemotaxis protein CheW